MHILEINAYLHRPREQQQWIVINYLLALRIGIILEDNLSYLHKLLLGSRHRLKWWRSHLYLRPPSKRFRPYSSSSTRSNSRSNNLKYSSNSCSLTSCYHSNLEEIARILQKLNEWQPPLNNYNYPSHRQKLSKTSSTNTIGKA